MTVACAREQEVPIRIHNSALVNAMLYDWAFEGTMGGKMHCDFERLDLSTRPFLEKSMELMVDGIEGLRQDQVPSTLLPCCIFAPRLPRLCSAFARLLAPGCDS